MHRGLLWFVCLLQLCLPRVHAADIGGDVLNSTNRAPVAGARVRLINRDIDPLVAKSDERGHFQLSNVEAEMYYLDAKAQGFLEVMVQPLDLSGPRQTDSSSQLTIVASTGPDGTPHFQLTLMLRPSAIVAGKIIDSVGLPMSGAVVELLQKLPLPPGRNGPPEVTHKARSGTNDKGEYRIAHVEPGTYYLAASEEGSMPARERTNRTTYYPGVAAIETARPLVIAAGPPLRADLQIVQRAGVHVAGRLITPQGAGDPTGPRVYTNIVLVPDPADMYNLNRPSASGQTGDYQVRDVLPGKYTMVAETRDGSSDPFDHKVISGLVRPIEVGERDMDNVDLTLLPLRDIAGQVTFRDGCSPVTVRISAQAKSPLGYGQADVVAQQDGRFVLRGLTPGRYTLSIRSESVPYVDAPVESILHGNRDVLTGYFEMPYAGEDPLRIILGCRNPGRPR